MRTDLGWSLDPGVTFLNHGSFGACPAAVLAVQREWRDRLEREPVTFLDRELEGHLDHARKVLGAFLGADPDGLVFVPNATTGVQCRARFAPLRAGDELLTTDHEYNAILNTVRAAADRDGARVVLAAAAVPDDRRRRARRCGAWPPSRRAPGSPCSATSRARPASSCRSSASSASSTPAGSTRSSTARTRRGWCRSRSMRSGRPTTPATVTSGCAVPRAPRSCGSAPIGGTAIHPTIVSHGANATRVDRPRFRLEFDWVGTGDPTAVLTLPAAIEWMAALEPGGWPAVMAANRALALEARDRLVTALGGPLPAPDALIGSMAAVPIPGLHTDAEAACAARGALRRGPDRGPDRRLARAGRPPDPDRSAARGPRARLGAALHRIRRTSSGWSRRSAGG